MAIPGQASSRLTLAVTAVNLSCRTLSTRPILEDNVKSSAPLALAGVFGCISIAGCVQTREANVPNPPATSYQVGSFELQESGSSGEGSRCVSYPHLFSECENADFARPWIPFGGIRLGQAAGCNGQSPSLATAIWWGPANNRHHHAIEWDRVAGNPEVLRALGCCSDRFRLADDTGIDAAIAHRRRLSRHSGVQACPSRVYLDYRQYLL
jgi:hypothetical protein